MSWPAPGAPPSGGMWSCCLPRARATTCSRTTRSGGRYSDNSWSRCERMTDRRWETRLLALLAAVLVVFGLTAVYGASSLLTTAGGQVGSAFALRQALGALVGGVAATLLARSDYRRWRRYAWPVLGAATVLLVIPLLPSELAQFAVVVWTAMLAAKKGEQIRTFRNGLLPFLVILAPLVGLIFLEPNLSMALLVAILAGVVLFTAGARIGHFLLVAVVAAPLVFGGIMTAQYRVARVLTFLNPGAAPEEATWQVKQSLVGIGAGRLFGVGLGQGQQKLGFRIARSAGDPFGQLLAVGLTALVGVTAALHIGVSLALLPATGITLPFISYGRSSLLVALVATGVLISVGQGRRRTDGAA